MEENIKKDLIKICSVVIASNGSDQFEEHFPDLAIWAETNITQEDQNEVIEEMLELIRKDPQVTINKDTFITLYAHVQAVIGMEQCKIRFPELRSLALNLMDEDELQSTLMLIGQIENSIEEKFNQ